MSKKSNTNRPKAQREPDAYDDLMDSYFGSDISPMPSYKDTDNEKTQAFKLNIKDLDSEFNSSASSKRQSASQPARSTVYRTNEGEHRTKPIRRYKPAQQEAPKKAEPVDDIGLMPAFENDKRFAGNKQEDESAVKPVYKKQTAAKNPAPQRKKAPVKKPVKKAGAAAILAGLINKPKKPAVQPAEEIRHTADGAVIIKRNTQKPKKDILSIFKGSKKAWITVLICIVAAVIISSYGLSCMNDILAIKRDDPEVITINLPSDVDTKEAIDILKDNKLIKHKYICILFAKFMDYRDDNYLAGIYYLTESMGLENMLSTFKKPTVSGETVTLTFPEGYNIDQIAAKLEKYEVCTKTAFYATIKDVDFSTEYSFIAEEDNKDKRYRVLEGYLYPDTYEFYIGENGAAVIRKFLNNFKGKWTDEYAQKAQQMGMSIDDVITLASIIEKEAYGDEQMPLVSSVLHNRLNKPGLFPTLQCDSTTAYINDYIAQNVTDSAELSRHTQNYSTYRCEGLPVGAICNPGNGAINAALNPSSSGYYYFAHDANKKIYLASNDAERQANNFEILKVNAASKKKQNNP